MYPEPHDTRTQIEYVYSYAEQTIFWSRFAIGRLHRVGQLANIDTWTVQKNGKGKPRRLTDAEKTKMFADVWPVDEISVEVAGLAFSIGRIHRFFRTVSRDAAMKYPMGSPLVAWWEYRSLSAIEAVADAGSLIVNAMWKLGQPPEHSWSRAAASDQSEDAIRELAVKQVHSDARSVHYVPWTSRRVEVFSELEGLLRREQLQLLGTDPGRPPTDLISVHEAAALVPPTTARTVNRWIRGDNKNKRAVLPSYISGDTRMVSREEFLALVSTLRMRRRKKRDGAAKK